MILTEKIYGNKDGFTLIEVLVALVIFTIGILAANVMQITSIKGNSQANSITESTYWGADRIERLLSLDYDAPDLDDTDSDGTDEDGDADGIDDDGGNFGLDDEDANADGSFVSPDNLYSIFWNVAVDHPFLGVKTINVIVIRDDRGEEKRINLTYMKANSI